MGLIELFTALQRGGVTLSADGAGRLVTAAPPGAITPEVAAQIRAHRDALVLVASVRGQDIPRLPAEIELLIRAASNGHITGRADLPSGSVQDLNGYVLAWAAAYLVGDRAHALRRLAEARSVWAA